jgi:hypothetical protein
MIFQGRPTYSKLSLPSAGDLVANQGKIENSLQTGYENFLISFESFLGEEPTDRHMVPELIIPFVDANHIEIVDFLGGVLSLYYGNPEVTSKMPNFSGVIFPNSRKMPENNLHLLELVVANTQWLKGH